MDTNTKVHHAIIDLYEVEDAEEVTALQVSNYTGLQLSEVVCAMQHLENADTIETDESGVATMAKNNGYNPFDTGDDSEAGE